MSEPIPHIAYKAIGFISDMPMHVLKCTCSMHVAIMQSGLLHDQAICGRVIMSDSKSAVIYRREA